MSAFYLRIHDLTKYLHFFFANLQELEHIEEQTREMKESEVEKELHKARMLVEDAEGKRKKHSRSLEDSVKFQVSSWNNLIQRELQI